MAQPEDTELRDLVIESLEKNGSLAKIRALLRANIFLAFEDDCENIKQNECLDNILKLPEGVLSLSIIHEFLEFCNLKNTLFVYMSETRQGKEYTYRGERSINEMLQINQTNKEKEPILVTILRYFLKSHNDLKHESSRESCDHGDHSTYIVNQETSSSTSQSQSGNSSDEKHRLDLRLNLDNSDTDTSSDSTGNKNSSEYVPNQHIVLSDIDNNKAVVQKISASILSGNVSSNEQNKMPTEKHDLKVNTSSESTSYVELKPFNSQDEKLLNTTGIPHADSKVSTGRQSNTSHGSQIELVQTLSSASSESLKREVSVCKDGAGTKKSPDHSLKYDTPEYSYDFSSPLLSGTTEQNVKDKKRVSTSSQCDKHSSPRSQSSISISDVTDLVSEKSFSGQSRNNLKNKGNSNAEKTKSPDNNSLKSSNDSGDFSESPIPSISKSLSIFKS
ncbi:dentin sialophosphoprotein-like [Colias croceus]|uniref:dentin sialophosphoprotein-like n=1 Tax=Colias crocea TaxID=72248 RepID=UPI001E27ABE0|nr:dentin sialophosphoprotein-like [Colias croceus]